MLHPSNFTAAYIPKGVIPNLKNQTQCSSPKVPTLIKGLQVTPSHSTIHMHQYFENDNKIHFPKITPEHENLQFEIFSVHLNLTTFGY